MTQAQEQVMRYLPFIASVEIKKIDSMPKDTVQRNLSLHLQNKACGNIANEYEGSRQHDG